MLDEKIEEYLKDCFCETTFDEKISTPENMANIIFDWVFVAWDLTIVQKHNMKDNKAEYLKMLENIMRGK